MEHYKCWKCGWLEQAADAQSAREEHDNDRPTCDGTPVKLTT